MSRLSATFVLNYLTRVVPLLGRVVYRTVNPNRLIKGIAIVGAIGGILGESAAFAAPVPFSFGDANFGGGPDRVGPAPNGTAQNYRTGVGVTVRMITATTGSLTIGPATDPASGFTRDYLRNLGYTTGDLKPSGGVTTNSETLTYNIDQIVAASPFETLGLRAQFFNAAGNLVPVQSLRFRVIDVDRDDLAGWQDEATAFATFGNASVTTGASILDPTGTVVTSATRNATLPTGLGFTGAIPSGLTFLGRDDQDPANSVFSPTIASAITTGLDAADGTGGPVIEAYNRSQEGSVGFNTPGTTTADGFIVLYSDGNTFASTAGNPSAHGLGILSDFDFEPGIIGVRKRATSIVPDPDVPGGSIVTYEVAVRNLGQTRLTNVLLDDNLTAAVGAYDQSFGSFGSGATGVTIEANSLAPATGNPGTPLVLNTATYTGSGATDQLLAAGNVLEIGEEKALTYRVKFTPNAGTTQFDSQVVAQGETPGGGITRDRSNDGTVFDGDGDGDPTAAGTVGSDLITTAGGFTTNIPGTSAARGLPPTGAGSGAGDDTVTSFIIPAPTPQIGVTKQVVGQPIPVGGGAYDVTYLQVVRNVSSAGVTNPLLINVQLNENLEATFRLAPGEPNGAGSAVVNPSSIVSLTPAEAAAQGFTNPGFQPLPVNPGFTGNGANDLLISTGSQLNRGEYGVIRYTVRVSPRAGGPALEDPAVGFFDGQVTATATGSGGDVTDLSDDVTGIATVAADDAATAADYQSQVPRLGFVANTPAGPQPRPSADGIPAATNRNNLTPVSFAAQPAIALSKRVTNVIDNGNGTFDVTYRQVVQNIGPTTLSDIQITEDLNTTFRVNQGGAGARAIEVINTRSLSETELGVPNTPPGFKALTPGTGFGPGNINMASTTELTPGQYGAVEFTVRVTPGDTQASYGDPSFIGSARATGISRPQAGGEGDPVSDFSEDTARFPKLPVGSPVPAGFQASDFLDADQIAVDPRDPSGRLPLRDEPGENTPTPVLFPQIAVAKRVSNIQRTGAGTPGDPFVYEVEYTVITTNVGAVRLENVQTSEPTLASVFPGVAATYVAGSLQPAPGTDVTPPALNSAGLFTSTQGLFSAPLALDPGRSTTVRYRVLVPNPPEGVTFTSQSTATGDGDPAPTVPTGTLAQGGIPVLQPTDRSDDGPFVDQSATDGLRGRGPNEDSPTPVIFPAVPRIGLTKQVFGTPVNRGDGTYDVTFRYEVRNTGAFDLTNVTIADSLRNQFLGEGRGSLVNPRPSPVTEYIGLVGAPIFVQGTPVNIGNGSGVGLEDDPNNPANAIATIPLLPTGGASIVEVVVRIRPGDTNLTNVYEGAAQTKGDVSGGQQPPQVTDISDDGTYINNVSARPVTDRVGLFGPEVPGLNDATAETRNPTPVVFSLAAQPITIFKAITRVNNEIFNQPLALSLPGAPAGSVGVVTLPRNLVNNDEVEYSLYIVNTTGIAQPGFEVCDPLRARQVFVTGSASSTPAGIAARDFDRLEIPGPAPLGRTCNLVPGADGQSPFASGTVVFPDFTLQPGPTTTLKFNVRIRLSP